MNIYINLGGLLLIGAIIWWFWFSKPRARVAAKDSPVKVIVDGGVYEPAVISAKLDQPLVIQFLRKDASPCAEKVIFDELGLSYDLAVNQSQEITITPRKAGEIKFTCQMGMYQGRIQVS
jgi:plastocyanin domain-containing protein